MAALKSLNEIFNNTLYRIPDYQRGYAWTPIQLKDFWDDLYNLNEDKQHYTGVLTVKGVPSTVSNSSQWNDEQWLIKDRGYKAYYVVDGQQRLTTSIILIQALVEIISSLDKNKEAELSSMYLGSFSLKELTETFLHISKPPHNIIRTYKFGYESDNPSFHFLRHRIFNENGGGTVDETFYTLNLENAKTFFIQKIKGVLDIEGEDELVRIFKKLTVNFRFNLYEIEEDFDVFVAFETMNNRGKKLSNLELLKNRLIYLTTLYDEKELRDDDRIALRIKIDAAWKEVYYQLGRNKSHPLNDDDFLMAHWIMHFQYSRKKGTDYINFLLNEHFTPKNIFEKIEIAVTGLEEFEVVTDSEDESDEETEDSTETQVYISKLKPGEIEDYITSLQSAAVHWYNTFNPVNNTDLTKKEQLWIDRLNRLGIAYFRPLVTASYLNEDIDEKDRVKLLTAIERFIFLGFRVSRSFSTYRNSEFYRAARLVANGEMEVEEVVQLLEKRLSFSFYEWEVDGKTYFDKDYFQKYINKHFQNGGGYYWWNGLRYFLYEYEMELVRQRGSQKIDWSLFIKTEGDKVSIEHIYPQTPTKPCWTKAFADFKKKEQNILQGSLGNLLPLSCSINSSLQNDCFQDKKHPKLDEKGNKIRLGYNNGSHSEIEVSTYTDWDFESILDRGIKMLRFMEQRWKISIGEDSDLAEMLGLDFLVEEDTKTE